MIMPISPPSTTNKKKNVPSSMSGGNPPTNTLRENLSPPSLPCECGDDRAGDPMGNVELLSTNPASSEMWSSNV